MHGAEWVSVTVGQESMIVFWEIPVYRLEMITVLLLAAF